LDVPDSEVRAFKAQYRKSQKKKGQDTRRVNLTKETWDKLSDSAKSGWDMLSRQEKDIVLADAANIKAAKGRANMRTEAAEHQDPNPEPDHPDPGPTTPDERHVNTSDTSKPGKPSPGSLHSILNTSGTRGNANQTRHATFQSHATFVSASGGYRVSKHRGDVASSLIDRGASNGGLAGSDMRFISVDPSRKLTITGIDNHQMPDLDVVQAGAYVTSHKGPVIAIFNQYAHIKTGASIHSSLQLEHYKLQVDDRSLRAGGTQCISTPEGYMFPLDIIDGLVYLRMRPYTDAEYDDLPHVPFTSDVTWDATVLDCTISDNPNWHDNLNGGEYQSHFDDQGRYLHRERGETMDAIITTDVNYITHSAHLYGILCCKSHT
jgi:hypothetical protein